MKTFLVALTVFGVWLGLLVHRVNQQKEAVAPVEEHGFTLADFLPDRIVLRQFRWDVNSQPLDAIDRMEAFYTTELPRSA